jgi:hypothetical protein
LLKKIQGKEETIEIANSKEQESLEKKRQEKKVLHQVQLGEQELKDLLPTQENTDTEENLLSLINISINIPDE